MAAPRILAGTLLGGFASLFWQALSPRHALPRRGFERLPFFAFQPLLLLSLLFGGLWRLPRDLIVPHLLLQPPHPLLRQMILPRIGLDPSRLT